MPQVVLQQDSTIQVFSQNHGLFTMRADKFTHRLEMLVNNVNWDSKARRALCAMISEATGVNYFDADLALIVAATIECNFDDFSVNYCIADSDDTLWVESVFRSVTL